MYYEKYEVMLLLAILRLGLNMLLASMKLLEECYWDVNNSWCYVEVTWLLSLPMVGFDIKYNI